ncbi:hypothetical protein [Caulobacter sp.]|uniref:hypothetical protein n=1 Tax=Caulobacter sp. TaxID=78 RepID=UPI003BB0113A
MTRSAIEPVAAAGSPMNALLSEALDAHGGLKRWREFSTLAATIVTGGEFWAWKGLVQDDLPRRIEVEQAREWSSLEPFGDPDWRTEFTPERIAILDGKDAIVAERLDPRAAFAGHTMTTPWDPLHRAYFNGYALWTYLTTPFVLAEPGFEISDLPSIREGGETWRGLRASFPDRIATHSREQDFYFGPDGRLRRHDYRIDVAGGFASAHLVSDFVQAQGLWFPTRRRAYQRNEDLTVRREPLMVSIDVSDISLDVIGHHRA